MIEILIKIPEGLKDVFENRNVTALDVEEMRMAIKNGTPLPKGHGDLIDTTFVLEAKITKDNNGISDRTQGWNEACQAIYENAPVIIEADGGGSDGK